MNVILMYLFVFVMIFGFSNCSSGDSDGDDDRLKGLILSVDRDTIYKGEQATFTVTLDGKDVTSSSVITNETTGKTETSVFLAGDNKGTYTFIAKYNDASSNKVNVEVLDFELSFQKNVLLQQITSTTCPLCPNNRKVMDMLQEMKPGVFFPMCFHGAYMGGNDPFVFPRLAEMQVELGIDGYAPVKMDYIYMLDGEESFDLIVERMILRGEFGFAIHSSVNANSTTATIDVKIKSMIDPTFDCKLAVAIVEDGLKFSQMDGYETIPDYIHNDVVRSYLTDLYGDKIAQGAIGKNKEFTKQFSYSIPANYKKENLMVIAYLLNAKQKVVMNCQGVKLGNNIDYQYVQYDPNADPWE